VTRQQTAAVERALFFCGELFIQKGMHCRPALGLEPKHHLVELDPPRCYVTFAETIAELLAQDLKNASTTRQVAVFLCPLASSFLRRALAFALRVVGHCAR
jgi:hypothetical protein